jgi:hypothetical protein
MTILNQIDRYMIHGFWRGFDINGKKPSSGCM